MKGSAFLPILLAATVPLILVGLVVIGSTLQLVAWRPPMLWADQFGSPSDETGVSAVALADSALILGGQLNATSVALGTPFLQKYSTEGSLLWTWTRKNTSELSLVALSSSPEGIYAILISQNYGIVKYDFNGNLLWTRSAGSGVVVSALSATSGGTYVAGFSDHALTNQSFTGSTIFFVREYDASGNVVWTSEFSNSTTALSRVTGIFASISGVYILGDLSIVGYHLNGTEAWAHPLGYPGLMVPSSISGDPAGIYVSGIVKASSLSSATGFLSQYDSNGNLKWSVAFDSPDGSSVSFSSLSADSSGVYLSSSSSHGQGFVIKFDTKGAETWSFETPSRPEESVTSPDHFLVTSQVGNFYLAGSVRSLTGTVRVIQGFSSSSSLIIFGVNPPISFFAVGALTTAVGISGFFLRKRLKRRSVQLPLPKQRFAVSIVNLNNVYQKN